MVASFPERVRHTGGDAVEEQPVDAGLAANAGPSSV